MSENHQYQTKAAMDSTKDILGVWIGEHESSKFWMKALNDLKNRGVLDVYLFCVDSLKGFVEAIGAVYTHRQIQRCIVHQIRLSSRFVSYKDIKPLMTDLKKVYTAVTENNVPSVQQKNCRALDRQISKLGRGFGPASARVLGPPDHLNRACPQCFRDGKGG